MSQPQPQYMQQQQVNNPLAVNALPDYITALKRPDQSYWTDMGHLEPSDFGLQFLKIVQGMTKQAKPGWGPLGNEAPIPQGTYFLDKTNTVVPPETDFIPLLRSVTYIKFKGKNTKDGIEFITKNPNDPRILRIRGLEWSEGPQGERVPPPVTKFVNFYVVTMFNMTEPAVLSFHRTSMPLGQQLLRDIAKVTQTGQLPSYICKFKLMPTHLERDGQNDWYQLRYSPNGFVRQESLPILARLYEMAAQFEKASQGIAISDDGTAFTPSASDAPAQQQVGQSTIIDVTPPPAVVSQAPAAQISAPPTQTVLITAPPVQPQVQQQPALQPTPQPAQQQAPAPVASIAGW